MRQVKLKGLMVGDPCTDSKSQNERMDMLWYAHKHGFLPDGDFDFLWNNCSVRKPSLLAERRWERRAGSWLRTEPTVPER